MANRRPPKLKRRYYGEGKPGVGYIPEIPPKPGPDAEWDDYWWKWVKTGTMVDEVVEPPAYERSNG